MKTSPAGIALITHFEGFAGALYRCPAGYWTIGYGHRLRAGEALDAVDEAMARALLVQDVQAAERAVARCITAPLAQYQFDALVSFTYNLGAAALQRSRLRRVINRGDYAAAPREFLRWVWAGGRKLPGLVRRRAAEAGMYGECANAGK